MIHVGDITKLNGAELPVVDVITGGSPCQDLSVAGKRAGLAGERSGLFMEQVRIVKEMREHDRSTGRTGYLTRPRYMLWENVPGAFSSNKGEDFRAVLEEIAKVEQEDAHIPRPEGSWPYAGCVMGDGWSIAWRLHDAQFWGVPQRRKRIALVADFGGQSAPEILFERKSMSGNSAESGEERKGTAEDAERGVGETGITCLNDQGGSVMGVSENVVGALRAQEHGHQPLVFEPGAASRLGGYCYNDMLIASVYGVSSFASYKEGATSLRAQGGDNGGGSENIAIQNSIVRRLTPLECERLQGFPDGWTDIGEWTDSKGKVRKCSDSARYKALGNSIAIPFWFYILRRMAAQYERPATLGSLFDGIGGFPLCWERCNGKGTAIWASEVEEFPIAVTKKRFGDS